MMAHAPISSKWTRDSPEFKIARALINRTTLEQGLTLDEICQLVLEKKELIFEDRDMVRKALKRVRKKDPNGDVLYIYADYIYNPEKHRKEARFFNIVDKESAKHLVDRFHKIIDGLLRKIDEIENTVAEPWEARKERIEINQDLTELSEPKKEESKKKIAILTTTSSATYSSDDIKKDHHGLWHCPICHARYEALPALVESHIEEHAKEAEKRVKDKLLKGSLKKQEELTPTEKLLRMWGAASRKKRAIKT